MYILKKIKTFLPIRYKFLNSSYSQEGEDIFLQRVFSSQLSGFYVDVGAHHPFRFSNTYAFYKKGWTGINIEPNPEAMALFKSKRRRDINLNFGVASEIGKLEFYLFDEPALNTFSKSMLDERLSSTPYMHIGTSIIEVLPLSKILDSYLPTNTCIDFMTVDVEGLDLEVLHSNDWNKYRPHWVLAEQLNLNDIENLDFEIHHFMNSVGYVLFAKTFNTLFYKDSSI